MSIQFIRPDREGLCEVVEYVDDETVLISYPEGGTGYWPLNVLIDPQESPDEY